MVKKVSKRLLSFVTVLTLVLSITVSPVLASETSEATATSVEEAATNDEMNAETSAAETDTSITETDEVTVTPDDSDLDELLSDMADNDELFESYVTRLFYGGVSSYSNYGLRLFADDTINYSIYNTLKSTVKDIAAGEQTSTQITIDLSSYGLTYTADELGTSDTTELISEGTAQFKESVLYSKIAYCLIADCPYDMYWFDKGTNGWSIGWSYSYSNTEITFTSITFGFSVISDYQDSSATNSQYTLDTTAVSRAQTAAANAQTIVNKYTSYSDESKLTAYKEEICDLVSYNDEAASDDYTDGYGDPWGLVYVFDGDSTTNVVCEGYSKAFQYLCDQGLSDAVCYTVTGTMDGGTGAGGHMWNIVTLDGNNYLADVTNSDSGTVGQNGGLFLVDEGDATSVAYDSAGYPIYTFTAGGKNIIYTYYDQTIDLYGDEGILTLGAVSSSKASQTVSGTDTYTKTYGDAAFTLDAKTNGDGALSYSSNNTSVATVTSAGKVTIKGAGTAKITVTAAATSNYNKGTKTVTITVKQASISAATLSATSYNWDGSVKTPSVTVKSGSTTLTKNTHYTVTYASGRKNLGTYKVTITGTGNYTGTITKTFTISATKGNTYTVGSYKYKITSATAAATSGTGTVTITGGTSTSLTSISVPSTVSIGGRTYNVTAIGASAFKGYTKATSITIGSNVTSIGSNAFYGCSKAKTASVGSKVTSIGSQAFYKCTALTKVTGCAAVTSVGSSAFYGCSKLATVAGLQKATSIGSKAFYSCTKLKQIGGTSSRITLAKVSTIGSSAFYKCTTCTYVNLSSTALTKIDASAFQGCTALKTFVSSSAKLTTIGKQAFYGDKKLASVTIKSTKLTSSKVGANAFKGIKSNCTFKVPSSKVSAYKKIFKAKGAGSKITVKKY